MKHALFATLAILSAVQPCSFGQAVSGTINGFVKDPTGAVVAGRMSQSSIPAPVFDCRPTNDAGFTPCPA